jgi:hypothetical protein
VSLFFLLLFSSLVLRGGGRLQEDRTFIHRWGRGVSRHAKVRHFLSQTPLLSLFSLFFLEVALPNTKKHDESAEGALLLLLLLAVVVFLLRRAARLPKARLLSLWPLLREKTPALGGRQILFRV